MRTQRIFDSLAATACVLGLVFACSSTEPPPAQHNGNVGSASGEDSANSGVGGSGASSNDGKGSNTLRTPAGDDDADAEGSGASASTGDDDDDNDDASTGSGGTGPDDDLGYAGYAYDPTGSAGESTDDPYDPGTTDDPGSGGGATDDPPKGGNTGDPPPDDTGDPPPDDTGDPGTGGATSDPPDECVVTDIAAVNVIVFGDATPNGADSEGTMWVAGNATFDGYAIGSKNEKDCDSYSLVVGGDLSGSGNANNGKIWVGGSYDASVNFTDCGISDEQPGPVDFVALEQKMVGISLALAAYPANGTVTDPSGALTFTGTDANMNVFEVTAEQIEAANEIVIDVPLSSTVIINVSGEELIFSGKGFRLPDGVSCRGGDTDFCAQVVWNMPDMEVLQASGIGIQGSVYAPHAAFSGNGGNVDGQLVVRTLTGGIEFHPYYFNGCLILPDGITL